MAFLSQGLVPLDALEADCGCVFLCVCVTGGGGGGA